ncbi:hypothetical protein Ahy_B02g059291 [Arachis hypogaea]|uniref:Protein FAR1-RELATED SEQUENCE n=1 Tax=Arachis hypogaea TaxID=3818 RepID=A0A445AGC8_ARAHY|nr:hypothetical protein Ahy_B02g059291 [Arachis hypogaea]
MRSKQRSESMHSFFNKFITQNNSLIQFVKQYDNCLGSREQKERESDAADFHTREGELHQKINEFRSRLFSIRSWRTSFQLNIQQVCGYLRLSSSPSEIPVLIIRVKRDIVLSRPKRVKL